MTRDLGPGDPIVYEDAHYICRWGRAVSGPIQHGDFLFPVIRVQMPDELPQWVPLSRVTLAPTRELPGWARREVA